MKPSTLPSKNQPLSTRKVNHYMSKHRYDVTIEISREYLLVTAKLKLKSSTFWLFDVPFYCYGRWTQHCDMSDHSWCCGSVSSWLFYVSLNHIWFTVGHCMRPVIDFAVALSRPSCGMMSGSIITYSCLHQRSIFNVLLHLMRLLHWSYVAL